MKIRNRHLVHLAGTLGSAAARGLVRSLRFEYGHGPAGPLAPPLLPPADTSRYVYSVWHENLLLPAVTFGCPDLAVLISKHADGQILGALIDAMGMGQVQGSTNRGGVEAVRKLLSDNAGRRHLAVTPDGPRGPRREVQPGIVYVASRAGMKVACVGVGYDRPWRAGSWDKFAIPKPTTRARIVTGNPITVPAGLRSDGLEQYRRLIQAEMERLTAVAEGWAATNKLHFPDPPEAADRQAA